MPIFLNVSDKDNWKLTFNDLCSSYPLVIASLRATCLHKIVWLSPILQSIDPICTSAGSLRIVFHCSVLIIKKFDTD